MRSSAAGRSDQLAAGGADNEDETNCSLGRSGVFRLSEKCSSPEKSSLGWGIGAKEMSQISLALLMALSLTLTGYYGLAAWRVSAKDHIEITGSVLPRNH